MKSTLCRIVLVGWAVFIPSIIYGQGFYTTSQADDNGYIDTFAYGYSSLNSCGGMNFWNSLDGNYISGFAPASLESGKYGVDGVDYVWNFGFNLQFVGPYGGCASVSYTAAELLGLHSTYYNAPSPDGYGNYYYLGLACTSGIPLCDSRNYFGFFVGEPPPAIIHVRYLVAAGNCIVGRPFDATGLTTRICT